MLSKLFLNMGCMQVKNSVEAITKAIRNIILLILHLEADIADHDPEEESVVHSDPCDL